MAKLVKNQLGFSPDLHIYQDKEMFNYSVDTILLGNFASVNSSTKHFLEIGTNNGALAIFLASRYEKMTIDAIEIQTEATELAINNIKMNNLESRISAWCEDFNDFYKRHNKEQKKKYDSIICNPPFYKLDAGFKRGESEAIHIATHEVKLTLEQIIFGASKLLHQKGYLVLVLPTERLVDCFEHMRKHNFEPKRVQFIHPRPADKSNLVLIEARFQSGWGTLFLPNLYLHPDDPKDHTYRPEIIKLYTPLKYAKEHHGK